MDFQNYGSGNPPKAIEFTRLAQEHNIAETMYCFSFFLEGQLWWNTFPHPQDHNQAAPAALDAWAFVLTGPTMII